MNTNNKTTEGTMPLRLVKKQDKKQLYINELIRLNIKFNPKDTKKILWDLISKNTSFTNRYIKEKKEIKFIDDDKDECELFKVIIDRSEKERIKNEEYEIHRKTFSKWIDDKLKISKEKELIKNKYYEEKRRNTPREKGSIMWCDYDKKTGKRIHFY